MNDDFVCPHCGAELRAGAKFCPECGSDENTGWSEDTYLDGVSLPGETEDHSPAASSGFLQGAKPLWVAVAILLLGVAAFSIFR